MAPVTFVPFFRHRYKGVVPQLTGVAVKVTGVPAQTGLADAAMVTEATGPNQVEAVSGVEVEWPQPLYAQTYLVYEALQANPLSALKVAVPMSVAVE